MYRFIKSYTEIRHLERQRVFSTISRLPIKFYINTSVPLHLLVTFSSQERRSFMSTQEQMHGKPSEERPSSLGNIYLCK